MPKLSGPEMALRLREQLGDIRVIFMSGHTDHASLRRDVLDGGVPFLEKPFTPIGLVTKVREVLDAIPAARQRA